MTDLAAGAGTWVISVDLVVAHPDFDSVTLRNDIALLHLAEPVPQGSGFAALPALGIRFVAPPTKARLVGWGSVDAQCEDYEDLLREGATKLVGYAPCHQDDRFYNDSQVICASQVDLQQNISGSGCGDSGGPLLIGSPGNLTQVGIVSYTYLNRDTFTRVSNYVGWIAEIMANPPNSSLLPPPLCHNRCCDNGNYLSASAETCHDWAGYNCSSAWQYGYSDVETIWLLGNCSATCGLCQDCEPSNADCCDKPAFVDALGDACKHLGDACKLWQNYDCHEAASIWGYTSRQQEEVLSNCPFSCGICAKSDDCLDSLTFVDEGGYICAEWEGFDCTLAVEKYGYSAHGEAEVLSMCLLTCKQCPARKPTSSNSSTVSLAAAAPLLFEASSVSSQWQPEDLVRGMLAFFAGNATGQQIALASRIALSSAFEVQPEDLDMVSSSSRQQRDNSEIGATTVSSPWQMRFDLRVGKQRLEDVQDIAFDIRSDSTDFESLLLESLATQGLDRGQLQDSFRLERFELRVRRAQAYSR
eukprot:CAMPEP_0115566616 /NCGR_PEP_ID=MMETSP0271-20121206/103674_1 /TAXON_ID=71861 /ORGANISM="Scrippsiella trochoidea, Strain CCMP3099" /LENGTH=528 /DNA_ID=CAMNT_0003000925 /DNA_START=138 /DNA_END=1721 /DNA_ORIENTATION=-